MEVQDTRESRREIQTLQEAVAQQNQLLQRLERSLRRLEGSYEKVSSRLDAVEAAREANGPEATPAVEKGRVGGPGGLLRSGGQSRGIADERSAYGRGGPPASQTPGKDAPPGDHDEAPLDGAGPGEPDGEPAPASRPNLIARAKTVIRGAIADGSVNSSLDRVQSSLKLADEAAGALSQISVLVKALLEEGEGIQQSRPMQIPGGSLALLLDLAKTPQFQKFIAGMLAQFLKDADPDAASSSG